jgi:hypothetical protein
VLSRNQPKIAAIEKSQWLKRTATERLVRPIFPTIDSELWVTRGRVCSRLAFYSYFTRILAIACYH